VPSIPLMLAAATSAPSGEIASEITGLGPASISPVRRRCWQEVELAIGAARCDLTIVANGNGVEWARHRDNGGSDGPESGQMRTL